MISILLIPLFLCFILVLIHVYFGAYVLKRGILFIDLALAQWAAFGYLIGYAYHVENPLYLFLCGFGATVIAAFILALVKPLFAAVNLQEAIIGVMYILAAAAAMAFISSTGLEVHHLKEMLTGYLLFVQLQDLLVTMILYAVVEGNVRYNVVNNATSGPITRFVEDSAILLNVLSGFSDEGEYITIKNKGLF